jgi:DNA-binding NarL/FixJ family response regulator
MAVLLQGDLARSQGRWLSVRVDPVFDQLYLSYYREHNELWRRAGTRPVESCYTDREVIPKQEAIRTEFYNDFLLLRDVHTALRAHILAEGDSTAFISIGRSPRRGEWERKHVDLMQRLASHLHRAAQINLQLGEARLAEASWAEVLNRLFNGVIIVSGDGKVLFVNRAAAVIAADADGVRIDATGLLAVGRDDSFALRKLIAAAATGDIGPESAGGVLALSRPSGRRSLVAIVAPLRVEASWFTKRQPQVIVFLVDPERAPIVPESYLRRLYRLTSSEAAVALGIVRGEGLQAVADKLRITLSTVRTHRQRVFRKTETRRQAELVRLISQMLSGIDFKPTP